MHETPKGTYSQLALTSETPSFIQLREAVHLVCL